jgi:hypothetical protein
MALTTSLHKLDRDLGGSRFLSEPVALGSSSGGPPSGKREKGPKKTMPWCLTEEGDVGGVMPEE